MLFSPFCRVPAPMVSEEVINFRLPKALYDMGQAAIDTGWAKNQTDLAVSALTNQIAEDLKILQKKEPWTARSAKTHYTTGKSADTRMLSIRINPAILSSIDLLIETGAAENRTAYMRRAYANEIERAKSTLHKYTDPGELSKNPVFREATRIVLREALYGAADSIR